MVEQIRRALFNSIPFQSISFHFSTQTSIIVSYPTLPCPTLPYSTIQYNTLLYHTLPFPTLPYHSIPSHPTPSYFPCKNILRCHAIPATTLYPIHTHIYNHAALRLTNWPHALLFNAVTVTFTMQYLISDSSMLCLDLKWRI